MANRFFAYALFQHEDLRMVGAVGVASVCALFTPSLPPSLAHGCSHNAWPIRSSQPNNSRRKHGCDRSARLTNSLTHWLTAWLLAWLPGGWAASVMRASSIEHYWRWRSLDMGGKEEEQIELGCAGPWSMQHGASADLQSPNVSNWIVALRISCPRCFPCSSYAPTHSPPRVKVSEWVRLLDLQLSSSFPPFTPFPHLYSTTYMKTFLYLYIN